MRRALSGPEIGARLATEGSEPVGSTPAEFRARLATEITKWAQIVREGQFRLD
jgi:tripartite-type tricarboxylate transporter receptor subunit TctC